MSLEVQTSEQAQTGFAEVLDPELQSRLDEAAGETGKDWLCAWCLHRVTSDADRFQYEGKSEFTFKNPEGIRFAILTFSQVPGGRQAGQPRFEYTWFPGHAWSFCVCGRCRIHLGWFYTGADDFAGLIRERIVRAVAISN